MPEQRRQALLQGPKQALHPAAPFRAVGGNVLDAELLQGPPDLGRPAVVDLLASLRGDKVMAAAIGVERAEQPVRRDRLVKPAQARGRALLGNQEHRQDLAGGIVQGDDQVELRPLRQPGMTRAVLKQQHAGQRPARPLLAMRGPLRRPAHQAASLQHALRPGVAAPEAVRRHERLMEVLHREIEVTGAKLLHHPFDLIDRHTATRDTPPAPINQTLGALRLIGIPQPAKMPLAHPQQLRRLHAAQPPRLIKPYRINDPGHPDLR
jgi:hypothetical protein